jgi:hypothetical protein
LIEVSGEIFPEYSAAISGVSARAGALPPTGMQDFFDIPAILPYFLYTFGKKT